jgi:hypothetical protein
MPRRRPIFAAPLISLATLLPAAPALARSDDPAPTPAPTPAPAPAEPKPTETKPADSKPAEPPAAKPESPPTQEPAKEAKPEPAPGSLETVLYLKDGTQAVGRLTDINGDSYTLVISGIPTRFDKGSVLRVAALPPIEERYKQMRATIPDEDLEQRYTLAVWLRDKKAYELALAEAESILKSDAAHPGARELKKMLDLQLEMDREAAKRRADKPAAAPESPDGPSEIEKEAERSRNFPKLSEDQINILRVFELDLANPPRLLVPKELIDELIKRYADDALIPATPEGRAALYKARPTQIIDLMYRLKARDLYGMVNVLDDPAVFSAFKRDVHQGWLINSCATSRCHGGEHAGRLMLDRYRPSEPATFYTNFLILERFRLADGSPLINYAEPEKSPLVQFAMPRNLSTRPHPVVRDGNSVDQWKPAIRSKDDRRYTNTMAWIRSMYKPRPDYGVTYDPPQPKGLVPADAPKPER